jgi:hypothetical protein
MDEYLNRPSGSSSENKEVEIDNVDTIPEGPQQDKKQGGPRDDLFQELPSYIINASHSDDQDVCSREAVQKTLDSFPPTGTDIDLSSMFLTDSTFIEIVLPAFAKHHCNWEILDLSDNLLGDASMEALARVALRETAQPNIVLREIYVDGNVFSDEGLVQFVRVLPEAFPELRKLSLCPERLRDGAVSKIVERLTRSSIDTLLLVENELTEDGALKLSRALADWPTLFELDVNCSIFAARELLIGMRKSKLKKVTISGMLEMDDPNGMQSLWEQVDAEANKTLAIIQNELQIMVNLCSVKNVTRLGARSFLTDLPNDIIRKVAPMLYRLTDLTELLPGGGHNGT